MSRPAYVLADIASDTSFANCVCSWMSAMVVSTLSIVLQTFKCLTVEMRLENVQLAMDILERCAGLLHGPHSLGVEARRLERVDLHLQLKSCALQPVQLLLRRLLPPQRSRRRCIQRFTATPLDSRRGISPMIPRTHPACS